MDANVGMGLYQLWWLKKKKMASALSWLKKFYNSSKELTPIFNFLVILVDPSIGSIPKFQPIGRFAKQVLAADVKGQVCALTRFLTPYSTAFSFTNLVHISPVLCMKES